MRFASRDGPDPTLTLVANSSGLELKGGEVVVYAQTAGFPPKVNFPVYDAWDG
jgi:hypothetical protein